MYDIIIKNGTVIDGTGEKGFLADVGIIGDKIAKIGEIEEIQGKKIIDAKDSVVTPGFIDMHSHADLSCYIYPKHESNLKQGITSFVGGNCGMSIAPLKDFWSLLYIELDMLKESNPFGFDMLPLEDVKGKFEEHFGVEIDWSTFPEYMDSMARRHMSSNLVPLIGHGQIRAQVMGRDYQRPASPDEIKEMQNIIKESMDAGAFGVSTGRDYLPGFFADYNELIEATKPIIDYDGLHVTHWMCTGLRFGDYVPTRRIDGMREMMQVSKDLGVRIHLAHLIPGYSTFPSDNEQLNRDAARATLNVIDEYIAEGAKVTFDAIPNDLMGVAIVPFLSYLLTPWLLECGGSAVELSKKLHVPEYKQNVMDTIKSGQFQHINPTIDPEWDRHITVLESKDENYLNKTIYEIALEKGISSVETLINLVAEEYDIKCVKRDYSLEAQKEILTHPECTPCSDAVITDLVGPWQGTSEYPSLSPTPNGFCYTVKYLKEFEYDSLEQAIRKLSGKAADILGIADRGYLKEGAFADIVIFNPNNLKTNENVVSPCVYPEGIDYVFVNGQATIEEGQHTGALAGTVIRKNK